MNLLEGLTARVDRVRGGKVQRHYRIVIADGYKLVNGNIVKQGVQETRRRKIAQKRAAIKRDLKILKTNARRDRSDRIRDQAGLNAPAPR